MAKTMTKEEMMARRKKELAILKANNELLESAKPAIEEHYKDNPLKKKELFDQLDHAQEENIERARTMYGASESEMKNIEYEKVSKEGVREYQEHLKKRNIEDDSVLYQKDISEEITPTIEYGSKKKGKKSKNDDVVHLEKIEMPVFDDEEIEVKKYVEPIMEPQQQSNNVIGDIPSYVSYDILPLPSNGECYQHKKDRLPVGHLTASDENVIMSPNLYRDGKVLDIILSRKILDKTIDPLDLVKGDRDALLLWLRATGYGLDFPIKVRDPQTGKEFSSTIQLDQIKTKDFKLKGNDKGWFSYNTSNGDKLEFKYLTKREEDELSKKSSLKTLKYKKSRINSICDDLLFEYSNDDLLGDDNGRKIGNAIDLIREWANMINVDDENILFNSEVTDKMIAQTMSVNGNTDREYIKNYIENMRSFESYKYRLFIVTNEPGMDFTITVNRPESLGGGSFSTFLGIDTFLFLSIPEL